MHNAALHSGSFSKTGKYFSDLIIDCPIGCCHVSIDPIYNLHSIGNYTCNV